MSGYTAVARTNYFPVEDKEAFEEDLEVHHLCEGWGVSVETQELVNPERIEVALAFSGSVPSMEELFEEFGHPGTDDVYDSVSELISAHIVPGHVAVLTELSHDGMREFYAGSTLITSEEIQYISLVDEAMQRARSMGVHVNTSH